MANHRPSTPEWCPSCTPRRPCWWASRSHSGKSFPSSCHHHRIRKGQTKERESNDEAKYLHLKNIVVQTITFSLLLKSCSSVSVGRSASWASCAWSACSRWCSSSRIASTSWIFWWWRRTRRVGWGFKFILFFDSENHYAVRKVEPKMKSIQYILSKYVSHVEQQLSCCIAFDVDFCFSS